MHVPGLVNVFVINYFVALKMLSSDFSDSPDILNPNPDVAKTWLVNPFASSHMSADNFKTARALNIERLNLSLSMQIHIFSYECFSVS